MFNTERGGGERLSGGVSDSKMENLTLFSDQNVRCSKTYFTLTSGRSVCNTTPLKSDWG